MRIALRCSENLFPVSSAPQGGIFMRNRLRAKNQTG
jgi:hypothetical protein